MLLNSQCKSLRLCSFPSLCSRSFLGSPMILLRTSFNETHSLSASSSLQKLVLQRLPPQQCSRCVCCSSHSPLHCCLFILLNIFPVHLHRAASWLWGPSKKHQQGYWVSLIKHAASSRIQHPYTSYLSEISQLHGFHPGKCSPFVQYPCAMLFRLLSDFSINETFLKIGVGEVLFVCSFKCPSKSPHCYMKYFTL